jgi:Anthrax toxin LF subunit
MLRITPANPGNRGFSAPRTCPGKVSTPTSQTGASVDRLIETLRPRTGIVPRHLALLQGVAHQYDTIIGIRPVDMNATDLISAGYPTKGFHIKGKSSNWGPQAGLICVEQCYSKLEDNAGKAGTFTARTYECMADGYAAAVPLTVSAERISQLLQKCVIDSCTFADIRGVVTLLARGPSGEVYEFKGSPVHHAIEQHYAITHAGEAIEVLAPGHGAKPFTADYDLLVIGPHLSSLGANDNLPISDVSHRVFRERIERYRALPSHPALLEQYLCETSFYEREDGDIGNASARIRSMIEVINQALTGNGERVVHHNADSGSPASSSADNYPATFFLPRKIGRFDEVCIIENTQDFAELVCQSKGSGYHIPLNPLWEDEVKTVLRPGFSAALAYFSAT